MILRDPLRKLSVAVLLLFLLYFSQGVFYPRGTVLSQVILLLILIICAFFLIKCLYTKMGRSAFFLFWTLLLVLNVLGFLFTAEFSNSLHWGMFRSILISSLPFYPFYYLARKGRQYDSVFSTFLFCMIPLVIMQFYLEETSILEAIDKSDVVNNISYFFVGLIPFVFLIKKRLLSISTMLVLFVFIIQGSKRGAIIAGLIGLICFLYYRIIFLDKRSSFGSYFIGVIGVFSLLFFLYHEFLSNEFLVQRFDQMAEGNSSSRDIIYTQIFSAWSDTHNLFRLLFGFGFAGSLEITNGKFAHNDWLELLSNFGLLGVSIYLCLLVSLFCRIRLYGVRTKNGMALLTIFLIWVFVTLVSMSYTSINSYSQAILLGYLMGSRSSSFIN